MRDDFHSTTKELLAKRVGYRCSNPSCCQLTSGPHKEITKTINVGVAAHITAASPGGPRYNASLSSKQRISAQNGIWLCQKCAKLIDNDSVRYTLDVLHEWKRIAEELAVCELEKGAGRLDNSFDTLEPLFHQRMKACQSLYYEIQKASGVIRKLFSTKELMVEDKQEIALKIGLRVAELANERSFYLDRAVIIHLVGSFVGLEDIFTRDNLDIHQDEIDKFNKNIIIAYKMLESVRETGKLDKTIKSPIIEYYNHLRENQDKNERK